MTYGTASTRGRPREPPHGRIRESAHATQFRECGAPGTAAQSAFRPIPPAMAATADTPRHPLEVRQLRYFLAVAETGQITTAAERLGMKQPPLSQQIRALEAQLDVRLFTRHAKGTRLTDAGALLLDEARRIVGDVDAVERLMARVAQGQYGRLSVAFTSSAAAHAFTPQLLRAFRARHAGIDLEISELNAADLTEAIVAGRLHCGILRVPVARPPGLVFTPLLHEPVRVALPSDHPLALGRSARPRPVALRQLAAEPFILVRRPGAPGLYANLLALCEEHGIRPHVAAEVERMMTGLSLVAAGVGVSVVPASMEGIHPHAVAYRRLAEGARLDAPLTLVHRADDTGRAVTMFTDLARQAARRHAAARR